MAIDQTYPDLIAVDWGTTNLRAYALDSSGRILNSLAQPRGVLTLAREDYRGIVEGLIREFAPGGQGVPVLLAGMVGSNRGWIETPYVPCPVFLDELADELVPIEGLSTPAFLVPGVSSAEDEMPDVMRGEETQIFGALAMLGERFVTPGMLCLPGTHTKWATADEGGIVSFRTTMSGELFDLIQRHSILAQTLAGNGPIPFDPIAFEEGADMAFEGLLLSGLFSVRARAILTDMPPAYAHNFVSGLIIGADVAEGADAESEDPLLVVASEDVARRYAHALKAYDIEVTAVDAARAFVAGAIAIAAAAGIAGEIDDEDDLEEDE